MEVEQVQRGLAALRGAEVVTVREGGGGGGSEGGGGSGPVGIVKGGRQQEGGGGIPARGTDPGSAPPDFTSGGEDLALTTRWPDMAGGGGEDYIYFIGAHLCDSEATTVVATDEQELDNDSHGGMKWERQEAGYGLLHDYYKQ